MIIREPDELLGKRLGGYRLERVLGTGMTGAVYLGRRERAGAEAEDFTPLPAEAAVKVLLLWRVSGADREDFIRRFKREAVTLQRLRHPHILPVITFGEDAPMGLLYMVLPAMKEGSLSDLLARAGGRLPLVQSAAILEQLADAIDYAHKQGVIHRDIKPANVLLDEHGAVQLADFSIARIAQDATTQTTAGKVFGSTHYMAPEQVRGEQVGPAADVYSLGALVYQMVTGQVPFKADSLVALAVVQMQQQPTAPELLRPDLPPRAGAAVLRALANQPQERFLSAGMLAEAFTAGLRSSSPTASVPWMATSAAGTSPTAMGYAPQPTVLAKGERRQTRSPGPATVGIAALVIIVGLVAALVIVGTRGNSALNTAATGPGAATAPPTATITPPPTTAAAHQTALVPSGAQLYNAAAPGQCDANGGQWTANALAVQDCANGALMMSEPNCACSLGVVTLGAMPGTAYPADYVVQVTVQMAGSDAAALVGIKFRQQSLQDAGDGRGGYSFLIGGDGVWQFNRYDADGTRHILVQQQWAATFTGIHTLDVAARGQTFTFYVDGTLVTQQNDATYASGFICLAAEPDATVYFSHFAVFAAS